VEAAMSDFWNVNSGKSSGNGGEKGEKDEKAPDFSNVESGSSTTAAGIYVVVSGDSLSKIAKREYGNANDWPRIYEANRDLIKDPDKIFPGQKLKIPPKS
jgi:nucleoid-associated protein YgaU